MKLKLNLITEEDGSSLSRSSNKSSKSNKSNKSKKGLKLTLNDDEQMENLPITPNAPFTPTPILKRTSIKNDIPKGYTFVKVLGSGNFGKVIKAIDNKDQKPVAIKMQKNKEDDKIFEKEIQNLQKVANDCDNLICIKDSGIYRDKYYIVMEFIKGKALDKYVEKNGMKNVEDIFKQIINGVKKLHSAGFAHMDIKPANIMVDKNNKVYIVDLGLACFDDNCLGGTQSFFPPDLSFQDTNSATSVKVRQSADIWAIGLTLARVMKYNVSKINKQMENEEKLTDIVIPEELSSSPYLTKVFKLMDYSKKRVKLFKTL